MRRALAIDERSFGPDHPNVAIDLNNLAGLLQATNRLAEAEPLMRRALAIDERSFGADHPKVAIRLNNLAQLLQATNRLEEAEPLMRRALGHRRAELRPRPPQRRHPPQQPGRVAPGHQPARRGRATHAPRTRHRRAELRPRPPQSRHPPQQPGRVAPGHQPARSGRATHPTRLLILLEFTRRTGHEHPRLSTVFENYTILLKAMGKTEAEIQNLVETWRARAIGATHRPLVPQSG